MANIEKAMKEDMAQFNRAAREQGASELKAMLAASLEEVLGLITHNDFSHDYEHESRKCEICKKLRRARKLLAANVPLSGATKGASASSGEL